MTLTIELTPEQEEVLHLVASAAGMEPGEYVKHGLFGETDPDDGIYLDKAATAALMAMIEDLRQTGARINQSLDRMNGHR